MAPPGEVASAVVQLVALASVAVVEAWSLVSSTQLSSAERAGNGANADVEERSGLLGRRQEPQGVAPGQAWADVSAWQRSLAVIKLLSSSASVALPIAILAQAHRPQAWTRWVVLVGILVAAGGQFALVLARYWRGQGGDGAYRLLAAGSLFSCIGTFLWPLLTPPGPPLTVSLSLQIALSCVQLLALVASLLTSPPLPASAAGEKPHPSQTASPLARLTFAWLDPLMREYYWMQRAEKKHAEEASLKKAASTYSLRTMRKRVRKRLSKIFSAIEEEDEPENGGTLNGHEEPTPKSKESGFRSLVPQLPTNLRCDFVLRRFRWAGDGDPGDSVEDDADVAQDRTGNDSPSLRKRNRSGKSLSFAITFLPEVLAVLGTALLWVAFTFVSPLAMNLLLLYVQEGKHTGVSPYLFVVGLLLGPLGTSVCFQQSLYGVSQLGLRLRSLIGHAVYAKLLRMKVGARIGGDDAQDSSGDTVGRANNLVGTDIDTITLSLQSFLQLLAVPFKLIVSLIYLYVLLSWAAFVALATIVFFVPFSAAVSSRYGTVQGRIMRATDRRVTLVSESIASMRAIKTFAWEKPMKGRVTEARTNELSAIKDRAKVFAGMMFLSTGVPAFVTLFTFLAYTYGQGKTLTASTAFTSLSLFGLLREAVISSTYLTSAFIRARVSLRRISSFVTDTEELDEQPRHFEGDSIRMHDAKFQWSQSSTEDDFILSVKKLEIPIGKITVIAGAVGSGKTALLMAMLGEMHLVSEDPRACTFPARVKTTYAAQEPWLQNSSIRDNIVFGSPFDAKRYRRTLFECALEDDLKTFEYGDDTIVGESGTRISGGQRSRVALARALYAQSEILLLDDVLSAVDSGTAEHLFKHCLNGSLIGGRTVVLVTHYVDLCAKASNCDLVVLLRDGNVETVWSPTHDGKSVRPAHGRRPSLEEDAQIKEREKAEKKKEEGKATDGDEGADSGGEGNAIEWSVYAAYFCSMGGFVFWAVYFVINVVAHLAMLAQGAWIGVWSNAEDSEGRLSYYFGIYAVIQIGGGVALTAMYLYIIAGSVRASGRLHQRLLDAVFAAPMRWFDRTPVGRIINRFSKDTETIDTEIVESLQPVFDYGAQVVMVAVVISVILPIFLIPAAFISITFFFVGHLYIRNALAARKNVAIARSPLFSLLGDLAGGASTIRAFGRQSSFLKSAKAQTDQYNMMQLYEYALDRWLEVRSDAVGACVAFIVGLMALSGSISPGTTGFLVSTAIEFISRILYVVRAVNQNELAFNSAHRVLEYTALPSEPPATKRGAPPAAWPTDGELDVDDFAVRYDEQAGDVLKGMTFTVKPGSKIGIVGKSGCGKTTFANALLRFMHFSRGEVRIDGRNIASTNLEDLRSRITMIPQDPTLFSGTIRFNLDPTGEHDEQTLQDALERSGFINSRASEASRRHHDRRGTGLSHGSRSSTHGLDQEVSSGGHNFSLGQRQLLSLARALVRRNKVVMFDEATASVDTETDRNVQRVIREEFKDATILTIAHRLDTIIDYDRIIVMQDGQVAEYDYPIALLDNPKSFFTKLCKSSGDFDKLYRLAKQGRP